MTDTPTHHSVGATLARASWLLFLGTIAVNIVGKVIGRRGILVPAIIGVILNGLLLLIWVTNFLAALARG